MKTNAKFKLDLVRFARKTNLSLETVIRKAAFEILSSVVGRSPVDTGLFKGSWLVQESMAPSLPGTADEDGSATLARGMAEIARFKVGGKVYILNHLPYAVELEYGYSGQAPRGMVRITAAEFQQYIRSAVGSAR